MAKPPEQRPQTEPQAIQTHIDIANLFEKLFDDKPHHTLDDGAETIWVYSKDYPQIEHLSGDDCQVIEKLLCQRFEPSGWKNILVVPFKKTFRQSIDNIAISMQPASVPSPDTSRPRTKSRGIAY